MATWKHVLDFWFKEATPKQWFMKDEAFDEQIRARFGETYERATRGELVSWHETLEGRLAEIIVLDQFSRNLFRNSPKAFEHDEMALTRAQEAVRVGADKKLPVHLRRFLYMPYMHSESRAVHKKALWIFASLLPWSWDSFKYELKHKRIIDRFGRYPHRNQILGRTSTPEEEEFLKTHKGF